MRFIFSMFVFAVASLVGPFSVGLLYDSLGSYTPGFVLVGSLSLCGALLLPVVALLMQRKQKSSYSLE